MKEWSKGSEPDLTPWEFLFNWDESLIEALGKALPDRKLIPFARFDDYLACFEYKLQMKVITISVVSPWLGDWAEEGPWDSWLYELELDEEGWVPVETLLAVLRQERPEWANVQESDLHQMIESSDKRRHEIKEGRIRALYGHSVPEKLKKIASEPPEILYHGTSQETANIIKAEGLRPMGRQYVHLSVDTATALQVGRRKSRSPVILKLESGKAYQAGVAFYEGNEVVWLTDFVPPEYIEEAPFA